jgi:hypothetical protein
VHTLLSSVTTVKLCFITNYTKRAHCVTRRSWQDICGKLNGPRDRRIGLGVPTTLRHGVQTDAAFNLVYEGQRELYSWGQSGRNLKLTTNLHPQCSWGIRECLSCCNTWNNLFSSFRTASEQQQFRRPLTNVILFTAALFYWTHCIKCHINVCKDVKI